MKRDVGSGKAVSSSFSTHQGD